MLLENDVWYLLDRVVSMVRDPAIGTQLLSRHPFQSSSSAERYNPASLLFIVTGANELLQLQWT